MIGLRQAEAPDRRARGQLGQPVLALRFAAELEDRVHDQRTLNAGEGAEAGIGPLQLLHDQPVRHVVELGTPVFLGQVRAEDSQLGHLRNQLLGKALLDVVVSDHRHHLVIDPAPYGVPHRPLFLTEQRVRVIEVYAWITRHLGNPVRLF